MAVGDSRMVIFPSDRSFFLCYSWYVRTRPFAPTWPVPNSFEREPPLAGSPGSFWEDRGDRHHAGVDLHAPLASPVVAMEDGAVLETGVFTSPEKVPYWKTTYFILIRTTRSGGLSRYAEITDVAVTKGDRVTAGQLIARIGAVLDSDRIDALSPPYIRALAARGHLSMLHFELYARSARPETVARYLGNVPKNEPRPDALLDPTELIRAAGR